MLMLCLALPAVAQKKLTILHTNDIHSRIEPIAPDSPDTRSADKGGLLRVAAYVEQVRKESPNVLVFDSGDFSQGTPYYNLFKGEVEIQLMNAIGYDAITIGNHEFDFGMENMAHLFKMAHFPVVCANYEVKGSLLDGLVTPYTIIKKYGLKIGVLGVGTQLSGMVQTHNYEGVVYHEPYEAANNAAAELKKKGCDIVICLSHLGYTPRTEGAISDQELAKRTRNIDLILGGHSHTFMKEPALYQNLDGKDVTIYQVGRNGIYVARIEIEIEIK